MIKNYPPVNQGCRVTAAKNKRRKIEIIPERTKIDSVNTGSWPDHDRVIGDGDFPDLEHIPGLINGEGKIKVTDIKEVKTETETDEDENE